MTDFITYITIIEAVIALIAVATLVLTVVWRNQTRKFGHTLSDNPDSSNPKWFDGLLDFIGCYNTRIVTGCLVASILVIALCVFIWM